MNNRHRLSNEDEELIKSIAQKLWKWKPINQLVLYSPN
jgi:hypothetical protein